jgi:hypothetical protein
MTRIAVKAGLLTGALLAGTALTTTVADASHFRGAAIVPTVSSTGLLTITTTSFWRNGAAENVFVGASSGSLVSHGAGVFDTTDSRFTKVTNVSQYQLSGAGTVDITASSCCRVSGIGNWAGSSSVSWQMDSRIVWNGTTANAPILFNFSSIQPEVLRGANYSDNLGATSGSGHTLSYNGALNDIPQQALGLTIDPVTGQLTIPAASTAQYADNPFGNIGADQAFSGTIISSDGSFVEFDWLFDGVDSTSNQAPDVEDVVINALVGSTINHTMIGTDPEGNALTWDLLSFSGGCGAAPSFDPGTQQFSWNSAGCGVGTYIANVRASDGSLTDVGTITINLANEQTTPGEVFEPATLLTFGAGLLGIGVAARRRRKQG